MPTNDNCRLTFFKWGIVLVFLAACPSPPGWTAQKFFPFDKIEKGLRGHGLTVFEGTRVEEFPVEVIGILPNIAPRRNLFLIRLQGEKAARWGVASGMSGSPIYLDGSLAGALSYTWNFSKEPVAAVTPIHEMLDLLGEFPERKAASLPPASTESQIKLLFRPERLVDYFNRYLERTRPLSLPGGFPLGNLAIPIAFSGIEPAAIPGLPEQFERSGFLPLPASTGSISRILAPPGGAVPAGGTNELQPGSAVAVKLIRGDVEVSAVGTVTHVDGDQVLAFGHPFLNLGSTDLPMALAEVQTLLSSYSSSFKFATPLQDVGSIHQDRMAGLAGRIGQEPAMLPVRLEIELPGDRTQEYRFEVVETPYLSPYLMYIALNGILSSAWKEFGEATVEIQEGSTFLLAGNRENVTLRNLFAGPTSPYTASATIAFIYHVLMGNEFEPVKVSGINLRLRYVEEPRIARIDRIWCDRDTVRAGETVSLSVAMRPYREPGVTRTLEIQIPEETRPGKLLLQVGNGLSMSRREHSAPEMVPRNLDQLILLINHLRTNDKVYVLLTREEGETVIRGERFSHLPLSRASVLLKAQVNEDHLYTTKRRILEDSIDTPYVIYGNRSLILEVR